MIFFNIHFFCWIKFCFTGEHKEISFFVSVSFPVIFYLFVVLDRKISKKKLFYKKKITHYYLIIIKKNTWFLIFFPTNLLNSSEKLKSMKTFNYLSCSFIPNNLTHRVLVFKKLVKIFRVISRSMIN